MTVYNYRESDYVFTYSEKAQLDPLKNKAFPETAPHYLIPSNSTTVAPPVIPDGKQARWTGQEWVLEDKPIPDPPLENYLIDLDFRLALIELGVN